MIKIDSEKGSLIINGNEFFEDYEGYDVDIKAVELLNLNLIPVGVSINLTQKVVGGGKRDYYNISPSAKYIIDPLLGSIAELSIFIYEEDVDKN